MARAIRKRTLTDRYLSTLRPDGRRMLVWDAGERGLAVQVHPTGRVVFKFIHSRAGRSRWVSIGHYPAMGLSAARVRARKLRVIVDDGGDPGQNRQESKRAGTLSELIDRHVESVKTKLKAWQQRKKFSRYSCQTDTRPSPPGRYRPWGHRPIVRPSVR